MFSCNNTPEINNLKTHGFTGLLKINNYDFNDNCNCCSKLDGFIAPCAICFHFYLKRSEHYTLAFHYHDNIAILVPKCLYTMHFNDTKTL